MLMLNHLRTKVFESIKNVCGKLLLIVGFGFVIIGSLSAVTVSDSYPLLCGIGFILGFLLVGIGFLMELEFYSSLSFIGKLGSVFVTVSFLFFGGVLAALSFKVVAGSRTVAVIFHGEIVGWRTILTVAYPYGWLVLPLFISGLVFLFLGFVLKFYSGDI